MPAKSILAGEALATLNGFGPFENAQKVAWRTEHYRDEVELLHPSRKHDDGSPAPVRVSAAKVDYYVGKGFTLTPEEN